MKHLPDALGALAEYNQFVLWTTFERKGGLVKLPIDHRTLRAFPKDSGWQQDPEAWTSADNAIRLAELCGPGYGVGFFFTAEDPFFFLDIDKCLDATGQNWTPVALQLLSRLPGAAVEVSQSGKGLHVIAKGTTPEHSCKNIPLGLELYTDSRFVALTGDRAMGDAGVDCSVYLGPLVTDYFTARAGSKGPTDWTAEPCAEWTGTTDDDELIAKAIASKSVASALSGRASFESLWLGDEDVLAESYQGDDGGYDASSADAALAQHLAFWTGNDCERIKRLMMKSGLVRDKWEDRDDYLERTIIFAVGLQETVYSVAPTDTTLTDKYGACKLKATSDAQRDYADGVRAAKLATCGGDEAIMAKLCKIPTAKFWLDNKDLTAAEMIALITPVEKAGEALPTETEIVQGYQYLAADQQIEHFAGCVYVQDVHKILTPTGTLLKSEQFNATYGGYSFQLTSSGDKTTRKAWDAFTESQVVRYPKAESTMFRPDLPAGEIATVDGRSLVNTYVPIETPSEPGDVTPFLEHLAKVLPVERDRDILLAYMAACIQHKGVKFQWSPLLQGTPGNGKTLFTRCVAFAIGQRYTHFPPSDQIAEKFNDWLFGRIFIGVEDVYVPEHKQELMQTLLPMITGERLAKREMQQGQVMADCCANFMMNTNPKDALRKTKNDRRIAPFFTAQQDVKDLTRDGMEGDYFTKLYAWLKTGGGYARVSHFLKTYAIPQELNPATHCHRAPETSSTHEAISSGLGGIEQEILEAIDEGRVGFAGGWVSSVAIEALLEGMRAGRAIPQNKRRIIMQDLGYDWHPALNMGRVNNPIDIDGFKKPRLFIKEGHIHANLITAVEVAAKYVEAQKPGAGEANKASEAFKR